MKGKVFFALSIMISILFACNQAAPNKETEQKENVVTENPNLKLQIYYFHATNRCPTCNSIEENVKKVIESDYKNELDKGIINFTALNIDEIQNKALAVKYLAYGSALHLVQIDNGNERDNDLTDFAFSYSRNKPEFFIEGINDTINYFLNH